MAEDHSKGVLPVRHHGFQQSLLIPSHLILQYEKDGISHATAVLLKKIDGKADAVKDLAYCLYDISANKRKDAKEATAYNALIADWTELTRQAAMIHDTSGDRQIRLNI